MSQNITVPFPHHPQRCCCIHAKVASRAMLTMNSVLMWKLLQPWGVSSSDAHQGKGQLVLHTWTQQSCDNRSSCCGQRTETVKNPDICAFTHLYNKGTERCTKLAVLTEVLCFIVRVHEGERLSLLPGILFSWLDDGLANRFDLIFAQNLQSKWHTAVNTDKNSIGNTLWSVKILNILMVVHTHTALCCKLTFLPGDILIFWSTGVIKNMMVVLIQSRQAQRLIMHSGSVKRLPVLLFLPQQSQAQTLPSTGLIMQNNDTDWLVMNV